MTSFFIDPYPDEFFYSIIARYYKRSGKYSYGSIVKDLFGKATCDMFVILPKYLDTLCKNISEISSYTVNDFIENNSILPAFRPFSSEEQKDKLISVMRFGGLIPNHEFKEKNTLIVKYCKKCLDEDKKKYGEPYLHRVHQIMDINTCPTHNEILYKINLVKHHYINLSNLDNKGEACLDTLDNNEQLYFNLSKGIETLFSKEFSSYNIEIVNKKYWSMLNKKGFVTYEGKIRIKEVFKSFINYYPNTFLKSIRHEVNSKSTTDWLKKTMGYKISQKTINPVNHILLINFLFGNINNFINAENDYYPFGKGPWPCLNPVSDHYLKNTINECTIKKTPQSNIVYGFFSCGCGYTYRRKGPDTNMANKYNKSSIVSYGDVWKDRLIQELKTNKSIKEISRIMGCDPNTVKRYIRILSNSQNKDKIDQSKLKKERLNQIKLEKKLANRQKVKDLISNNPYITRTEIKNTLKIPYRFLYRYDSQWMCSILPTKKHKSVSTNWLKKDTILADRIRIAADEILREEEVRITLRKIQDRICYFDLKANLYRLPLCTKVLKERLETRSDYRKRIIENRVENYLKQGKKIRLNKIYSCNGKKDEEKIKEYIKKIIKEKTEN